MKRSAKAFVGDPWNVSLPVVKTHWEILLDSLGLCEEVAIASLLSKKETASAAKIKEWIGINCRRFFIPEAALEATGYRIDL